MTDSWGPDTVVVTDRALHERVRDVYPVPKGRGGMASAGGFSEGTLLIYDEDGPLRCCHPAGTWLSYNVEPGTDGTFTVTVRLAP